MVGPSVTIIPLVFEQNTNVAAGMSSSISGLVLTFMPYLLDILLTLYGWRICLCIMACLVIQSTVMGALFLPSKIKKINTSGIFFFKQMFPPGSYFLYIAGFLTNFTTTIFVNVLPDFAYTRGMSTRQGSLLVTIVGFSSLISRFLASVTVRVTRGKSAVLLLIILASRCIYIVIPSIHSFWPLISVSVVIGLGWGLHACLVATSIADIFGLKNLPSILPMNYLAMGLSSYLCLPFAGR